jgi:catechol 2,3-dioxygenase-like lactoylglutathione lyase family enzyme
MLLTEIDHIAIAVKDLEAAIAYYAEAFGAEVHHREIVESDGVEEALVKVADSYIQLTAATRPASRCSSRSGARVCTTSGTASTTARRPSTR